MKSSQFIIVIIAMQLLYAKNNIALSQSTSKLISTSEKLNSSSIELESGSETLNLKAQETKGHVQKTVQNVKSIVNIFEPIFKFHLKSKQVGVSKEMSDAASSSNEPPFAENSSENTETNEEVVTSAPEPGYNSDGTAMLGSQNHKDLGCYIDIATGTIMDDVDAAGKSQSIDLIFTATDYFGSAPMYAFLSPALVKNDVFANYYFRGNKYKDQNIPAREWDDVNESEIAMTNLTLEKFEKIQNNNQLQAVVRQTGGFKDRLESRSKLNGKVIAVKTHVANREAYGLIAVVDQFGTTGPNSYLKIKIKVTGFDQNGDGIPEQEIYMK